MTLTQLSYIVAVAQYRNFGAAAEACHVTQPTLSMQVQKFEDELGVVIFNRSQQPIRLTEVGEAIAAQARIVLAEARKIPDLTIREIKEVRGSISIGVIPTLSPYLVPLFVESFTEKNPKVQLSVEELQTSQIVSRLMDDSLDVGLLATPLHNDSVVEHPLFYEPFLLYLSPDHPLARSKKVKEADLSLKDAWLLTEGHCFRDQAINLCGGGRAPAKRGNLRFESGNLETLRKMVDRGEGFTFLPWLAANDLHEPDVKKRLREFAEPVPTREVSLVHNRLYNKKAIVEALRTEISAALPKGLKRPEEANGKKFLRVDLPAFKG